MKTKPVIINIEIEANTQSQGAGVVLFELKHTAEAEYCGKTISVHGNSIGQCMRRMANLMDGNKEKHDEWESRSIIPDFDGWYFVTVRQVEQCGEIYTKYRSAYFHNLTWHVDHNQKVIAYKHIQEFENDIQIKIPLIVA